MKIVKPLLLAFVVGGIFSVIGEGFTLFWLMIIGPGSPLLGLAIMVSMGVVGAVMFVTGTHQSVEKAAGFGAMLPFNGLCAAIAHMYTLAATSGKSTGAAVGASLKLIGYVLGVGCALILVVTLLAVFFA
jgi:hypothetical protein